MGARFLLHSELRGERAALSRDGRQDGKELAWRKTDSQTWHVELSGANAATIQYQVFGDTLRNNQAQYDERHAFIGGPSVWMYLVGGKERPIELTIAVPSGWKVATGMEHTSDHTFHAENYDWFADAPLEISDFAEKDFQVMGTTYHVIVHDVVGQAGLFEVYGRHSEIRGTRSSQYSLPSQARPHRRRRSRTTTSCFTSGREPAAVSST